MFNVIENRAIFSSINDALIGGEKLIYSSHASYAEASEVSHRMNAESGCDDTNYYVAIGFDFYRDHSVECCGNPSRCDDGRDAWVF